MGFFLLLFVCFELYRFFPDGEDLLVFHLIVFVMGQNFGFDVVLNLGFGLLTLFFIFKADR